MSEAVRREGPPRMESEEERRGAERAARERARAYLERYIRQNERIERMLQFQRRLKDLALRTTGDPLSPPGSGPQDDRSGAVVRLIDLESEIDREVDHLYNIRGEIWRVLERVGPPMAQLVLTERYLNGLSVKQLADREGYTPHRIRELDRRGLEEVDRILREECPMQGYVGPVCSAGISSR